MLDEIEGAESEEHLRTEVPREKIKLQFHWYVSVFFIIYYFSYVISGFIFMFYVIYIFIPYVLLVDNLIILFIKLESLLAFIALTTLSGSNPSKS